jgi:hypothetical protein
VAENERDDLLTRKHEMICFRQIFNRVVQGDPVGPRNSPNGFFSLLLGFELIKPDMGMDINYAGRKKILQALLIEFPVNRLDLE